MSSTVEYVSIPVETRTHSSNEISPILIGLGFVFILIGIPLTIFGSFEYNKVNHFAIQSSSCRVNTIETQRKTKTRFTTSVYPIWNVDVIQQSPLSNPIVLTSNLQIKGSIQYHDHSTALEHAQQLYSVIQFFFLFQINIFFVVDLIVFLDW